MHPHVLTHARALWGCPPFGPLLGGGGGHFAFVKHFSGGGGGLENYLGAGLDSGVWEGVLFFVSHVHFYSIFLLLDCPSAPMKL